MKLIFRDETVILRIGGKLVRMAAGVDVDIEFPEIDRDEWLSAEIERIEKGGS